MLDGRNEPLRDRQEGKTVPEAKKVTTEPAAIRSALEGFADRLGRIGIEASSLAM
jgi:transposase